MAAVFLWTAVVCGGHDVGPGVAIAQKWTDAQYLEGRNGERPPPAHLPSEDQRTVHVMISSYRDELCGRTLYELFAYSQRPDLVTVGLVEQFADGDVRCVERYCELVKAARTDQSGSAGAWACPHMSQIRVKEIAAEEAGGPMHARSHAGSLLKDEEFCLQIDSHTQAVHRWDVRLVEDWAAAQNEYAVLSTYIQRVEDMKSRDTGSNVNNWHEVPVMCDTTSGTYGMVRNAQAYGARALTKPLRSCFWGAGLSFSKCHLERRVPHDPHSRGVFDGEEFTRAIRMWTHGYDLYAPSRSVLFHDYTVAQRSPKRWTRLGKQASDAEASYRRLKGLLGMLGDGGGAVTAAELGVYGMGRARTKAAYEGLCGLSLKDSPKLLPDKVKNCGKLPWIPFNESDMVAVKGGSGGGGGGGGGGDGSGGGGGKKNVRVVGGAGRLGTNAYGAASAPDIRLELAMVPLLLGMLAVWMRRWPRVQLCVRAFCARVKG